MDVSNSDADFDSYWEEEARNPNRNRIRIGRQYQATVPPLLKHGESDGRKLEELETLRWKSDNELTDQQLDQYLSVAKAVDLFARAIDTNYSQNSVNNSETHRDSEETTETNTNSNENNSNNCDKSEDKSKENNSNSGSTSSVKDQQIQSALKGLSEFVSTHHPIHHDIGCRVPTLPNQTSDLCETESTNSLVTLLSSEWNPNEAKLFSRALEVCGKNFSAIKKDFLPWKSVKSIIDYYYVGNGRDNCHLVSKTDQNSVNESESSLNTKSDSLSNSSDILCSSVSKFMTSCAEIRPELNDCERTQSLQKFSEDNSDCDLNKNFEDLKTPAVSGQEVKPLKAKPILPTAIHESNNNVSTVGSLKFFLDGQLVLKLNAQQELLGQKCQWVESLDTSKRPRPTHKTGKRLLIGRPDPDLQNHSNNHKYLNSDDLDDVSNESSDDDSMESNESALVPSPSAFIAKKAKVKLENSCHKPLSSPTSHSLKDQNIDSNSLNRNIKSESSVVKREHLSPNSNTSEDNHRRRPSGEQTNDKKSSLENKWYHTIVEKPSSLQPPKAHSSTLSGQSHRHSRYDSMQSSLASSSSSSSTSSSSSSSSQSSSTYTVPVPTSVSTNAIPVDLTRKSTNFSPFEAKSSPASSSAPNFGYPERDKNYKVLSSPSPPRLQPPFVFPYPAYLPLSPTQSQHKIKKEVKSSNNLCQKVAEGRPLVKSSPPSSPSSMHPSPPSLPSQLAWLQNPLVSYLPIYEQYYRYYYGYGMPAPNHSTGERSSSSQTPEKSEPNSKERAKCLTDAVLVDGDDANCGS